MLQRITVFTGSAAGHDPVYATAVTEFAHALADAGIGAVYGGGHVGLMGAFADALVERGGDVRGVMPQALVDREIAHTKLTHLEVVANMHQRKERMAELGDGFVALPGGAGTLEELFEAWTWQQLGIHAKPVALLDVDGFWQPLVQMIASMTEKGFIAPTFSDALIVEENPRALVQRMLAWTPPASKWEK